MKLFFAPGTCALACMIALEEAGADYETERVDFKSGQQQSPAYLAVNPKGRVPALATKQGTLTETPAILAYIAQRFPDAGLAPADPFLFAKTQELNSYLCATVHVAHAHGGRGYRWSDDAAAVASMKAKVPENIAACYALIESGFDGPWVIGDRYSIADAYLFVVTSWIENDGVRLADYPKVSDHHARMRARPAVRRALERQSA